MFILLTVLWIASGIYGARLMEKSEQEIEGKADGLTVGATLLYSLSVFAGGFFLVVGLLMWCVSNSNKVIIRFKK